MAILKDTIVRYANASYAPAAAAAAAAATTTTTTTAYPNLSLLLQKRRSIANAKSKNSNLVKRELQSHHSAISEYNNDQLSHYFQLSQTEKPLYSLTNFTSQPQVNPKMRFLIFDFIMYCHTRLNLSTSTLFLTFTILDKYSSRFIIKSYNYQLLSLTALWISSKFWDSKNRMATLKVLQNLCCNQYSIKQFTSMEMHLFKSLDWSICQSATFDSFIDIFLFQSTSPLLSTPTLSAPLEAFIQQKLALLNDAAGTAINKSSPQSPAFNINEIKLGAIMLCELASFNLELSFKYDRSLIALGAINLIKLSLNYYNSNVWENFDLAPEGPAQDLDISLSEISNLLLDIAMDQYSFPSSFKSKYLNHNKASPAKSLLDALQNYCVQLKLEEFYRSQELETMYSNIFAQSFEDDPLACVYPNTTTPKSATASSSAATDYFSDHTHIRRLTKENISTPFAFTPTSSSSSPSPFTSPYKTSSSMTTPDSAYHHAHSNSFSSTQYSFKRSLSIPQNSNIFWPSPLTPTTPSLMSNRKLLQNLPMRSKRLMPIRPMVSAHSYAAPTHLKKRSTSSTDCDFNDGSNLKKTR
ncbi:hypothetical protein SEUBUCD646_0A00360 [Saccharomyces eubayanus]|uniref:Cyclin-like domain-containing protein n=1 Tax=Saccharomyces eubayanus TaxID=1080349 RepID=A0ABN8VJ48_SACEU|nr:hypothetical protein SEUBUCD650_0A00350 [Saccharomyces eubayanus]CAI1828494.1 hypothetical protein SEUBUCD646_0A00360 [Saccharomyces eubayanus]